MSNRPRPSWPPQLKHNTAGSAVGEAAYVGATTLRRGPSTLTYCLTKSLRSYQPSWLQRTKVWRGV